MQDTEFKVGDIVTWSGKSEWWQGGKAEVVSLLSTSLGKEAVTVKVLESVPRNPSNSPVGRKIEEYKRSLTLVKQEAVAHPAHYGGDTTYEVIKVAEAWGLDRDAYLFNVIKYVARAGKKDAAKELEDLKKGLFYYQRRIKQLEEAQKV